MVQCIINKTNGCIAKKMADCSAGACQLASDQADSLDKDSEFREDSGVDTSHTSQVGAWLTNRWVVVHGAAGSMRTALKLVKPSSLSPRWHPVHPTA